MVHSFYAAVRQDTLLGPIFSTHVRDWDRRLANLMDFWSSRFCRNKPVGDHQGMVPLHVQLKDSTLRGVIKRLHFPLEIMLVCVRW